MAEDNKSCGLSLGPSPAKKKRYSKGTICMICQKPDIESNLVQPTQKGVSKLFECLKGSKDDLYYRSLNQGILDSTGFKQYVHYHRVCYQTYTFKSAFAESDTDSNKNCETKTPVTTRSSTIPLDRHKCIFCNCAKKKGDFRLISVCTTQAENTIQNIALSLNDPLLLTKVQDQDLIALEAKYHKNCFSEFFRNSQNLKNLQKSVTRDIDPYSLAFRKLIQEIENEIHCGVAFYMSSLVERYNIFLHEYGHDNPSYKSDKLKRRLLSHFGTSICFQHIDTKHSELIYSSAIDIRMAVNTLAKLKAEAEQEATEADLKIRMVDYENLSALHTALSLRKAAREVSGISVNPILDPTDISINKSKQLVPPSLLEFIIMLMFGKHSDEIGSDSSAYRYALSVAQDIIYGASFSRCKTPKHTGLAISLKHLTGSRQVIDLLHSQGHCLSYDDVLRVEASIAETVLSSMVEEHSIFLPSNIYPGTFAQAAMDNININEETRSGEGTTHVLGSLLYQEENSACRENVDTNIQITHKPMRSKSVNQLDAFSIIQCPYESGKVTRMVNLTGKVNIKDWFREKPPAITLNQAIIFARLCPTQILSLTFTPQQPKEQKLPGWSGFHDTLSHKISEMITKTNIGYNPVIQGLPIDKDTMYTGLKLVEKQLLALGQNIPVVTLDLQLYVVAQEIRNKNWDELGYFVLRLGGFHIMELMWKILGRRYSNSGLEDILVEAKVFGPNAASVIMQGKNHYRCLLAHKLMYESLSRLRWQAFLSWMVENHSIEPAAVEQLEFQLKTVRNDITKVTTHGTLEDYDKFQKSFKILQDKLVSFNTDFEMFLKVGQKQNFTFQFWSQYLDEIQLCLDYIGAEKIPDWDMHLKCFADMLCFAFSYDRPNYARWGSVYLSEMFLLPQTAPEIHEQFMAGKHAITRSTDASFNSVWSDLGLEQSLVKDTKSKQSGIIGYSRKHQARLKWFLTVHKRNEILREFKTSCKLDQVGDMLPRDLNQNSVIQTEVEIQRIMQTIEDRYQNMFSVELYNELKPEPLVNISTGMIAPPDVTDSLLNAYDTGKESLTRFVQQRIIDNTTSLNSPIKQLKLPTFASVNTRKGSNKIKDNTKSLESDRELFARLLVVSKERKVNLKDLFQYELASSPLAICNIDGSLAKTNKSQTMLDLEKFSLSSELYNFENINKSKTAVFIDHMACVQKICSKTNMVNFEDLLINLESVVLGAFHEGNIVHVVSDRYDTLSIKSGERKRRSSNEILSPEVKITSRSQNLPRNIKFYLSNPRNKDNLNNFTFTEWTKTMPKVLSKDQILVLAGGFENHEATLMITDSGAYSLDDLSSTQEEADSRLYLHIVDAIDSFGIDTAIIWSPDTDVFVLGLAYYEILQINLWFKTGTKNNKRYIPIHSIASNLGMDVCRLLIPFHTLTGCDSTSCFKGRGKKKD